MPFVAYVHAREPDPPEDEGRTPWEPNWRIWRLVAAAIGLSYVASLTSGWLEVSLVFLVFALCCRAALDGGTTLHAELEKRAEVTRHLDRAALARVVDPAHYLGTAPQMVDRMVKG